MPTDRRAHRIGPLLSCVGGFVLLSLRYMLVRWLLEFMAVPAENCVRLLQALTATVFRNGWRDDHVSLGSTSATPTNAARSRAVAAHDRAGGSLTVCLRTDCNDWWHASPERRAQFYAARRSYRWWSLPTRGRAITPPVSTGLIGRDRRESLLSERCVRESV